MEELNVTLRHLSLNDYPQFKEVMDHAYDGLQEPPWERRHISTLLRKFPEGQIVVEVNGRIAGAALAITVDYRRFGDSHTYDEITGNETFKTHDPDGDVLYGIDVFVDPEYRGMRLARRMYDFRKELCESLNLRAIIAGGRIPGYRHHSDDLKPREYIDKVKAKEIYDPILTFQISNDFRVKKVLRKYLPTDEHSREYATLIQWDNIYYEEKKPLLPAQKRKVRIGAVQWQMRPAMEMETVLNQAEYFIDTVSDYESDFIVFPETFNAPLLVRYNDLNQAEAMRRLAEQTEPILRRMREFAVNYNVNIIAGSMPVVEEGSLYNVAYLCRRDGSWESIRKIHITPSEKSSYGMVGGDKVCAFDTDCGKIGILICYDVEFPELGRILKQEGIEILFVPFMTDLQNGYNRVRLCAQARAVENEIYVCISGSVGNLPRIDNMDIQFSQSAVFSPSDFAFPSNGIVAEATPNTEMVLIADVDLDLLMELHESGSVTNIKDIRRDLYSVKLRK